MKQKRIINIFTLAILMLAMGCATTGSSPGTGSQAGVITGIDVFDNKLNIVVDRPFTYTVYKSSDPYKVIVELPDVRLGFFTGKIKTDKAGISEITPSQTEEPLSTRLEILLTSPVSVEPVYKDTSLAINVKGEPAAGIAEAPKAEEKTQEAIPSEKTAEPVKEVKWGEVGTTDQQITTAPVAEVKEEQTAPATEPKVAPAKELPPASSIVQISIEKGQETTNVVIKGNGSLNPNVFRLDSRAVLDIPNVELAASVPAAVSPLKNIRAGKHKDKTRLVFDMKEGTSFDVAAVEDSVIVAFRTPFKEKHEAKTEKAAEAEVKTAVVEPEKIPEGKYKGQRISLDFQDADIGPIFRLLADISGYNFVIDPAVKGKITMKLMNVPWDQALDIILQTFNLGKSVEGNIIWIAPTTMFAKMAEEKSKAKDIEEKAEDIMQEVIRVNYATASDISKAISDGKLLSSRGSVTIDNRMNTLIVKDTQKSINKIKELVKIMDVSKPQVMIEAKIVEVSSDYSESLGIRWGGSFYGPVWPNTLNGSFSVNTPVAIPSPTVERAGGALGMTIGNASTIKINLSLEALEQISKAKKLSNPKVLTIDNEKAEIQQGTSIPVQTVSAEGTKTEYVNATLKLSVQPKITPEGYVQLQLEAANDSLGILTPQGYAIEKKSVKTQALVKNGDTLVIGGIYTTSTVDTETGVPLLSRIPILGWLFKTKTLTGPSVKELLVFITPTIVSQQR